MEVLFQEMQNIYLKYVSTRVFHLKLGSDFSTDSFAQTLRRFIRRRSYPKQIRSDYAAGFVSAERETNVVLLKLQKHKVTGTFSRSNAVTLSSIVLLGITIILQSILVNHILNKI